MLTLNLQHGTPARGTRAPASGAAATTGAGPEAVLREAARRIAAVGADLVLLQEVDQDQARSGRVDQTTVLARELGLPHARFAASFAGPAEGLHRRPPRSGMPRGPGYGVALLSRHPLRQVGVHRLGRARPQLRRRRRAGRVAGWTVRVDGARVCLTATVQGPAGALSVAVTHLSTVPATARRQLRRCEQVLLGLPGPHLLGGDLNLEPADVAATTALRPLARVLTFTNARPRRQLDHLLGDGGLRAVSAGVAHHLPVSDHAGLGVELVLVGGRCGSGPG